MTTDEEKEQLHRDCITIEKMLCAYIGRPWAPTGISIHSLANGLAELKAKRDAALAANPVLVWWTTQDDCDMVRAMGFYASMTVPEYIKREFDKRVGRSGRGRLWCPPDIEFDSIPESLWKLDNPAQALLAQYYGGIVFRSEDWKHIARYPGVVFTVNMEFAHDAIGQA